MVGVQIRLRCRKKLISIITCNVGILDLVTYAEGVNNLKTIHTKNEINTNKKSQQGYLI
ncbi:hypothetical protein H744_2c3038 [Photobacterium gaetbulicola Gung47]|uniref:Uncharacterized protein n=1 Tax=Photobacterium gaetbulicola Gung47 TaxID=658445 RepID=A0A0C5WXD5_9GAMM|nr:hypothetical protein H744_2c3038 [Photobacterium gaetbulicola Gung47]